MLFTDFEMNTVPLYVLLLLAIFLNLGTCFFTTQHAKIKRLFTVVAMNIFTNGENWISSILPMFSWLTLEHFEGMPWNF